MTYPNELYSPEDELCPHCKEGIKKRHHWGCPECWWGLSPRMRKQILKLGPKAPPKALREAR